MTPSERLRANREAIHAYLKADDEHAEDAAQVQAPVDHGKCQEANEKSFCLVVTLRLTGVI